MNRMSAVTRNTLSVVINSGKKNTSETGKFKIMNNKFIENELIANRMSLFRRLFSLTDVCLPVTFNLDRNIEMISSAENMIITTNGTNVLFKIKYS